MYGLFEPEENLPDLSKHKNILGQVLTPEIYKQLYYERTSTGFSLDKGIQLGVDVPESPVGFTIGDEETCTLFEPLLKQLVLKCQKFYNPPNNNNNDQQSLSNKPFIHKSNLSPIKYNEPKTIHNFILDIKFYVQRNLKGYSLPCHCTRGERREINILLVNLLKEMTFDFINFPFLQKRKSMLMKRKSITKLKLMNSDSNSSTDSWTSSITTMRNSSAKSQNNNFELKIRPELLTFGNLTKLDELTVNDENKDNKDNDDNNNNNNNNNIDVSGINENKVIDLSVIDEGTLSELEDLCLAPDRQVSLTEEYLVSGLSRDFPDARSLFYNIDAGIGAWTNHENHFECVILHETPDLNFIYKKFVDFLTQIKTLMKLKEMEFIRNKQFGYIVTSPKHLGTGLTIAIDVRCPLLGNHKKFKKIITKHNLEIVGQSGAVYHMETINTLGRTEQKIVQSLADTLILMLRMEKTLAKNQSIDTLI